MLNILVLTQGYINMILTGIAVANCLVMLENRKEKFKAHAAVCLHSNESTINIFKSIVRSIYSGTPPTAPVNTRAELHCIFSHVVNILNSRPLSSQNDDALALNANQLVKPYIINADQEILVSNFLDEVFNVSVKHLLLTKIFHNYQAMAVSVSQALKTKFLENAKLFSYKPGGLRPLAGDVVLVLKDQPNLGLIREVLSPRRVVVRHKNRGANTDHQYHCKILALLFRPTSSVFFISTFEQNKAEMGHLLKAFWSRLKQQIT